ncbi:hypothetical protein A1O7_10041 [Cladophialophora yegresii CBS 114405]|uniref:3-phytase n=1 Tax=Cladophialophora yegresii CBS 114405 TaxID=1182544 RepID=W9VNV9_9EURO|nr:uncharacterized protein A1O7_10041 [Cladophialophora yegresii CBS 114405]EXJ54700.1 hypothetical protein A1O7_10041 [Cladophialophora yegresii CBS 114405]
MVSSRLLFLSGGLASAAVLDPRQATTASGETTASATEPWYYQTTPELFAGPTTTGLIAPFLAQTNPAPWGAEASFVPNAPLETNLPIQGNTNNQSIFQLHGQLSSYFPNPIGFGSNEYPLPPGANISTVHLLHRHGARYPTGTSSVASFGSKIQNITANGTAKWTGDLGFLNNWKYNLGAEILVARGRQELFDSGVLFYYNYGALYNTSTKIIARTTTQDRMLKSAEYFMAGFFGLEWTQNASLVPIIEQNNFNITLAGYMNCNNSNNYLSTGGNNASVIWENIYLADATKRLKALAGGYNWTVADSYNAQTLCPYEHVAFGYSQWCDLFTYEEWQGFEYSIDLQFNGNNGFGSPTGRAVGIGYVEELYARLQGHLPDVPPGTTQINTTMVASTATFPLNQTLYFDFSHDTNIFSIITAFGLKQFGQPLGPTGPPANRQLIVWEIIHTPQPLKAIRPTSPNATASDFYANGTATTYIHLSISQRTVPLYKSYPQCEERDDGWCELSTVLEIWSGLLDQAEYDYSCNGKYPAAAPGNITNGVPISKRDLGRRFGSGLEFYESSDRWVL